MPRPSEERRDLLGPGCSPDAERSNHQLLAARLRAGAWIVLAGSLAFVVFDLLLARSVIWPLVLVKTLQCLIVVALILATRRVHETRALAWIGAVALSGIYFTTATSALLRDEILTSILLLLATVMATASFLPWGALPQLLSAVCAAIALAAGRLLMPLPLGREAIYRWLGIAIALSGSVWIAREHERQRRERRHAEHMLAVESRVSAALARAGEEIIRRESTPGVLDSLCGLMAELLSCEQTALLLYDAGDDTFVVHSSFGHRSADAAAVRALRVDARVLRPLLEAFKSEGSVQVDTAVLTPEQRALHERYRVAKSLYVPIRQAGEINGILSAHSRDAAGDFSDPQRRIAIGIAHLASMALQNTRLLDELREANRLKSDFVSTMSHELRTPVSVILGYTEMLADDQDRDERAAILERIRRSGFELLELVEETLNLSRLEAGRDPPRFDAVQVPEVFAELGAEFAAMVPLGGVALRWQGPESLVIRTDRRKLRMILKNLVGNALKFTVDGEVVLACSVDDGDVRFVVRDTGIGIAPQHLPFIFDMFRQADSSDARSYRGAGLGLYIVQRLVHQLGGEIHVSSEIGQGSTFTFTLPIEPAEEPAAAPAPPLAH